MLRDRASIDSIGRSFDSACALIPKTLTEQIMEDFESDEDELTARLTAASSNKGSNRSNSKVRNIDKIDEEYYTNIYRRQNVGLAINQFCVGIALYFSVTPLWFYMVDTLDATPAQQSLVTGLTFLPWGLKIFFGFIVDSLDLTSLGLGRRKPILVLGWLVFILSNIGLAALVEPDICSLAALFLLSNMGYVQADVCCDAMIVERSKKYETPANRGQLQATGYTLRFGGGVIGAILGACLYNQDVWGWGLPIWGIFLANACTPLVVFPFLFDLVEVGELKDDFDSSNLSSTEPQYNTPVKSKLEIQCQALWILVQKKAVWMPCGFICLYNMMLLTNPAWNSFLVNGLGFSNFALGLLTLCGTILSWLAIVVYKRFFFDSSWRMVYLLCTLLYLVFTGLQLVLIFQLNKNIGMGAVGYEILFAMGSYGMIQFIAAIQFLPACRLFLALCPKGSEGTSYAMLTSLSNLASVLAYSIAALMANIWNVSNDELSNHNYDGMYKLTLLTGIFVVPALVFLPLLPENYNEVLKIIAVGETSKIGGTIFTSVVTFALIFTIVYTFVVVSS